LNPLPAQRFTGQFANRACPTPPDSGDARPRPPTPRPPLKAFFPSGRTESPRSTAGQPRHPPGHGSTALGPGCPVSRSDRVLVSIAGQLGSGDVLAYPFCCREQEPCCRGAGCGRHTAEVTQREAGAGLVASTFRRAAGLGFPAVERTFLSVLALWNGH